MPFQVEHEGKTITAYTEAEVEAEVKGLKVTNENLKAEKKDLADKVGEAKEQAREMEEAKAKAEGDNETLQRLAEEREAEKRQAVDEERKKFADLLNMTKQEKVNNTVSDLITRMGAGGDKNEDLRDLVKARFKFDYDIESGAVKVEGDGVQSIEELEKAIKESGRYDRYLAGSGATGGGAAGGQGAGVTNKKFSEMNDAERLELKQRDPAAFQAALNNR